VKQPPHTVQPTVLQQTLCVPAAGGLSCCFAPQLGKGVVLGEKAY